MWRRIGAPVALASGSLLGLACYVERPRADTADGFWYNARGQEMPVNADDGRRVDEDTLIDKLITKNQWTALGRDIASGFIIPVVAAMGHIAIRFQNTFDIKNEHDLVRLIQSRPEGVGLLTVSNHTSVLDDPFLLSAIVPLPLALRADRMRWGACSQEVCFSRGPLASAFFGAGKTNPIKRGGGLDQPALRDAATKLASGDWVHVFPEGHVYQDGAIGCGRGSHDNERSEKSRAQIGALKWGTAKLIAHAPGPLHVIPFVHDGMSRIMPYDHTGKCESKIWKTGKSVKVRVGTPLDFTDLITAHEVQTGSPVRRYGEDRWITSSPADRVLYARITRRLEAALVALQTKTRLSET